MEPVVGPLFLGLEQLQHQHWIKPHQHGWLFMQREGDSIPLPNPQLTRVTNFHDRANWKMDSPDHQALVVNEEGDDENEVASTHRIRRRPSSFHRGESSSHATGHSHYEDLAELTPWQQGIDGRMRRIEGDVQVMRGDINLMRSSQMEQMEMIRAMHNWHISQGHYPPLHGYPPPPP